MPIRYKVAIISNNDFSALDLPLNLAKILSLNDFTVDIIAPSDSKVIVDSLSPGIRFIKLAMLIKNSHRFRSLEFWVRVLLSAGSGYDAVIGVDNVGFVAAHIFKKIKRAKTLVYYALELSLPSEHWWVFANHYLKFFCKHSDIVISTGIERASIMQKEFGLKTPPTIIHNCPMRHEIKKNGQLERTLRVKLGVDFKFIVIYHGGLNHDRAVINLINSAEKLEEEIVLAIMGFGDPGYIEKLRRLIKSKRLEKKILLLGWLDLSKTELLDFISGADIGIALHFYKKDNSPGAVYWTPNKIFEYMACGLPMVTSDNPSLNFITDLGVGSCVNPDDPGEIAEAVNNIYNNKDMCDKMKHNCRRLFDSEFNYEKQSRNLVSLIREKCRSN
ncbi:MAG: glycosyltransferase [Candidatus Omnitrophota bacterium]|jgi:glycosyltransferase involved in cell wall biosynthesis|nr:MAG: glycosyltransferase [Candidatus Omnitrophota bacterium]